MSHPPLSPCSYRHTFLRRHVNGELGRIDDVLGLKELVDRHCQGLEGPQCRRQRVELLERFFSTRPDLQVYIPVRVQQIVERRERPKPYPHFTDLLVELRDKQATQGVLLEACSGAGKTVAQRKAFFDCLRSDTSGEPPPLEGYVPCVAKLNSELPAIKEVGDTESPEFKRQLEKLGLDPVLQLLAQTAELQVSTNVIRHWLDAGPPLLLFVDLNAFEEVARHVLAYSLRLFQQVYGRRGHRVVAAYRSAAREDGVLLQLTRDGMFQQYDMLPLKPYQAAEYLRALRRFERELLEESSSIAGQASGEDANLPDDQQIEAEVKQLMGLIDRHVGRDSLISTPLLMHLVTIVDSLPTEPRLSDLYQAVVEQYIEREQSARRRPGGLSEDAWRCQLLVAMTRLALLIGSKGAGVTRAGVAEFRQSLKNPEAGKPHRIGGQPWWPADPFWHKSI